MKGFLLNITSIIFISLLLACGGAKKVMVSAADISRAEDNGTLEQLYQKVGRTIEESSGSSKKDALSIQSQIVNRIVATYQKNVSKSLSDKTALGLVTRQNLNLTLSEIQSLKGWDQNAYANTKQQIDEQLLLTNSAIDKANQSAKDNESNLDVSLKFLKTASLLAGENESETTYYKEVRKSSLETLSKDGRTAFERRMFNTAIQKANMGLSIDAGNIQFESLLAQAETSLFEQKFNEALQNAKPEVAYNALLDVADKPIMLQIKKKMGRSILLLANYFAGNAQGAYQKGDFYLAYNEFLRGRDIQNKLSASNKGFIQEKAFLDLLKKETLKDKNNFGKNYALLQVIKEFDDSYPTLNEALLTGIEKITSRSTTKIAISPFSEVTSANSVVASVGRRIASKLEKILFSGLKNEILVVTDISRADSQDYSGPHYQINGEILQAAIETNRSQARRSKNVQTGINKVETVEYLKWKKRSKGDSPVRYLESAIMEDIILSLEHIRKLAVVELDYKIISPVSQKVLVTNNINKESNFKGTTTQEFQKGMFLQDYIQADLPSDIKIMDNLATELSVELGEKLTKYLTGIEKAFFSESTKSLGKGEKLSSIELLANAVVMDIKKSEKRDPSDANKKKIKASDAWLIELKKQVLEFI
ncbi:MAG: hypothetical protein COB38_05615 [Gammaproteobacteria bacterium]|nr:MAG: hypothetical protein COB38_05615 [Gammaproteobacteria bacterium]